MAAMEKEYETQKVPRVKGPEKGKQRGKKKKKSECARAKKSKFWLLRMRLIKILYILVPNLGEIYLFGK